jgi:hypothetical protein
MLIAFPSPAFPYTTLITAPRRHPAMMPIARVRRFIIRRHPIERMDS